MKYDDDQAEELLPQYRHPFFISQKRDPLPTLYDAEGYPVIGFAPVPQQRRRKFGWDEARQQAFIAILARVPSVSRAARMVGMSARSAYKLLDKPGADQFAQAWDMALEHGMTRLRGLSIARCLDGGDFVPVYRKGRLVRVEHRPNDQLAIALLSGRARDVDHYRRGALTRWRQKREWEALDNHRAAEKAAAARERLEWARAAEKEARPRGIPRIRQL